MSGEIGAGADLASAVLNAIGTVIAWSVFAVVMIAGLATIALLARAAVRGWKRAGKVIEDAQKIGDDTEVMLEHGDVIDGFERLLKKAASDD